MSKRIIRVADGFWNIRGSFKVAGVLDVGTQASLVRRANGSFVFLDAYTFPEDVAQELRELTSDGNQVEAILNLHPFHTVHVRRMHEQFPNAKLYGTARHIQKFSELPWEALRTEDTALHAMFEEDFQFSVPRGVDFISKNENVHFSSVLAYHRASKTIHVDDTFMYLRFPKVARAVGKVDALSFHPTLAQALERKAGAVTDFRRWAEGLIARWEEAENLCAAHTAALTAAKNTGAPIHTRLVEALAKVERTLRKHERKYG